MRIIIASSNKNKLREIAQIFSTHEIIGYHEILEPFEVIEDGKSFKENALIKARAIHAKLPKKERESCVVLSDDSGLCVPLLGGAPGIYSARYAGEGASDRENNELLIKRLKEKGTERTPAYYTAAIAMIACDMEWSAHGWLHGEIITIPRGERGFGYDPMFVPLGENRTLAEMEEREKNGISHRAKALTLAECLLHGLTKSAPSFQQKSLLLS